MDKNFLGLRTCIYIVPNLEEAKAWYSKAFGLDPYFDESFYVGFNIAGYELGLLPEGETINDRTANVHCYWGVSDIYEAVEKFKGLGAKEHEAPTNVGGELMVASLKDPWNNLVGLIYNPHFQLPD